MNKFLTLGLLLFLVSCGQNTAQTKSEIDEKEQSVSSTNEIREHQTFNKNIDSIPEVLKSYIPIHYSVINISSGDANLDGLMDKIVVLRKNSEETTSNYEENKPEKRPLLLLLAQADNSYKLAYRNDNAVYCIDCGGAFGDPFTGTTIRDGYFSIEHGIAGGQHWEQVITFKYDKSKNDWLLYKDHFVSYKLNESDNPDAEAIVPDIDKMKTTKDFGIIPFDKFDIYNENEN